MELVDQTEDSGVPRQRARREQRQRRVEQMERLGLLAGRRAHELSNLLTGILGKTELLMRRPAADDRTRESLEAIRGAADRAADLMRELASDEHGGIERADALDLVDVLDRVECSALATLGDGDSLRVRRPERPALVNGDGARLHRALVELVANAADAFGGEPGSVLLTCGLSHGDDGATGLARRFGRLAPGPHAYLEVSDDGRGMDADFVERAFEPRTTTRADRRGLGLPTVLEILRLHHGAVDVLSRPGEGTSVRLLLPVVPGASGLEGRAEDGRPTTVLLIDDEPMVRSVLSEALSAAGLEVHEAADGQTALEIFERCCDEIDAVLLDLTLPDLDGVEVLRRLRLARPELPVVVASGRDEREVRERCDEWKAGAYLRKPFRPSVLVETLRELLGRRCGVA